MQTGQKYRLKRIFFSLNGPLNAWREMHLGTGCIKALIKIIFFFIFSENKSMNLKLHMFEWYFKN